MQDGASCGVGQTEEGMEEKGAYYVLFPLVDRSNTSNPRQRPATLRHQKLCRKAEGV
jgi:hypothetical protein